MKATIKLKDPKTVIKVKSMKYSPRDREEFDKQIHKHDVELSSVVSSIYIYSFHFNTKNILIRHVNKIFLYIIFFEIFFFP